MSAAWEQQPLQPTHKYPWRPLTLLAGSASLITPGLHPLAARGDRRRCLTRTYTVGDQANHPFVRLIIVVSGQGVGKRSDNRDGSDGRHVQRDIDNLRTQPGESINSSANRGGIA